MYLFHSISTEDLLLKFIANSKGLDTALFIYVQVNLRIMRVLTNVGFINLVPLIGVRVR